LNFEFSIFHSRRSRATCSFASSTPPVLRFAVWRFVPRDRLRSPESLRRESPAVDAGRDKIRLHRHAPGQLQHVEAAVGTLAGAGEGAAGCSFFLHAKADKTMQAMMTIRRISAGV
jgi:hypothetical protein